eukprot:CAMPEP_0194682318 /NCGR_PEP_ID=MMETSP0295-20121207/12689_1 /TAXON_ID=39354 /ORGANISM="Heterosigma akashiwo, Strain CCMP2393" /LENGTH=106 /DNA_ID=CAMNT_0039568635 /DNA_START=267 /DNA_END=587 /DNA_ORIENTATION=-
MGQSSDLGSRSRAKMTQWRSGTVTWMEWSRTLQELVTYGRVHSDLTERYNIRRSSAMDDDPEVHLRDVCEGGKVRPMIRELTRPTSTSSEAAQLTVRPVHRTFLRM